MSKARMDYKSVQCKCEQCNGTGSYHHDCKKEQMLLVHRYWTNGRESLSAVVCRTCGSMYKVKHSGLVDVWVMVGDRSCGVEFLRSEARALLPKAQEMLDNDN